MMCDLLGATDGEVPEKRLAQFWQEIDIDQSKCIEFEEFLLFYVQNFLDPTAPHGSPMKNFYRRAAQRGQGEHGDDDYHHEMGDERGSHHYHHSTTQNLSAKHGKEEGRRNTFNG